MGENQEGLTCNISQRGENGQTDGVFTVSCWDNICFSLLPQTTMFFFLLVYTFPGDHHSPSWHHSQAVIWPSWICPAKRKIISVCIPTRISLTYITVLNAKKKMLKCKLNYLIIFFFFFNMNSSNHWLNNFIFLEFFILCYFSFWFVTTILGQISCTKM